MTHPDGAITPEARLMAAISDAIRRWAGMHDISAQRRCEGLTHELLCILDGLSQNSPGTCTLLIDNVPVEVMLHEEMGRSYADSADS